MDLFTFKLGAQFLFISKDGLSKPEVYLANDLQHDQLGYTPFPVSTINGIKAQDFLQKAPVNLGISHDPNARLNTMLFSVAKEAAVAHSDSDPFALNLPDTTLAKLKNGTRLEFSNTAWLRAKLTTIRSGADLYDQFGRGNGIGPAPLPWSTYKMAQMNFTSRLEGYPEPDFRNKMGSFAGFLFNNSNNTGSHAELDNTAVLMVNSFGHIAHPLDFEAALLAFGFAEVNIVTTEFLRAAKASGKSKLILDLQGNGGGQVATLLILYFSLFPNKAQIMPMLWQIRAHHQLEFYGNELFDPANPTRLPGDLQTLYVKPGTDGLNSNGSLWSSFDEVYGPVEGAGGNGEFIRASVWRTYNHLNQGGWNFHQPFDAPPFRPEDIVIVTDRECASACAILVDILVNEHGVRTVAMGGRPIEAPMQAIGEVKGGPLSNFLPWSNVAVNLSHVPVWK